ncbi:alanine:cation symporter family protein [Helcobacillus massiliensis]|uniref:alanine/glycine:cation symporter family protein n=1 Tax=Helcobacillus massiliensis TaxID=521392 RepID=UPI0021A3BF57|nr:alanine/glycine:cation symporter family protein [Helcobacillus massiliensis]MCT1557617.1 alanine:cation symporter family protein [Helcobacillus massiliensis]MCT2035889.1 alanine:cation symporter family protein [Helcobacillus massiliensis]MCT2331841.1 alanine:cation symporter family protein [Helcobacillus massiliensis]
MEPLISWLNDVIWSDYLVYLCLLAGLYFTIRTLFLQVLHLPDMFTSMARGAKSPDGISSFQSLMLSLAGRVGMGNIGGVATAIAFGGPGAVFWMWAVAFLGSATSFVESTLGQIYKEKDQDTGEYRGGPAYFIEKSFAHTKASGIFKVYAIVFAIITILAMSFFLPGVQANGVSQAVDQAWGISPWISAIVLAGVLAAIVFGGIKRIATFAGMAVPFMAVLYILAAIIVMIVNFQQIPEVFGLIFRSAFDAEAAFSGMIGAAIAWGVKRGIYSNEAGQGTGPHAAAASEVSHPAKQGFVQSFAVYVDTLFVCSATAFMIISTGAYNVYRDESIEGAVVHNGKNMPIDQEPGPAYVQSGLDSLAPGFGPTFVAIAIALFCFTTVLAYYYMAETNFTYMNRYVKNPAVRRGIIWFLRILICISVIYGAVSTSGAAWALGDIGVGSMAWLNIVAVLIMQGPALKALKDYRAQKKAGKLFEDITFDPRALGIAGATFWENRLDGITDRDADVRETVDHEAVGKPTGDTTLDERR